VVTARIAADEAAFPFEWEVQRLYEPPPPPPRVPFDPQARIAGWEGTLLTRLLASAVPARWAAQAEMAAVLVEELGCDASAPIAAGAASHAVPDAAGVPVDAASDYTLMHAAAAMWLAGLGGTVADRLSRRWSWPELDEVAIEQAKELERQPRVVPLRPHQAPTPPPRVAAAGLRYTVDRVPALGAALRERRRGGATTSVITGVQHGSAAAVQHAVPPALSLPCLQLPLQLESAGLTPMEAALGAGPYLWPGLTGLRFIPAVHEIVASGDRDAVERYLGVDLPRLSAALLPVWAASGSAPAPLTGRANPDEAEPALLAAEAVVQQLDFIGTGQVRWRRQRTPAQLLPKAVALPCTAPSVLLERWLRLQALHPFVDPAGGDGAGDAACLDLAVATRDELRGCLRKAASALRAARAAADEDQLNRCPNAPVSAHASALCAASAHGQRAGAAGRVGAPQARRGCCGGLRSRGSRGGPPPTAWWPTPPQLAEEGDAEVAAAAAEVAVAGVLHGWPAGDVWLALGLVGAAGRRAWLRRLLAELAGLYAPADGKPAAAHGVQCHCLRSRRCLLYGTRHGWRPCAWCCSTRAPPLRSIMTRSHPFCGCVHPWPGYARLLLEAAPLRDARRITQVAAAGAVPSC
jgi:hypothetical protein